MLNNKEGQAVPQVTFRTRSHGEWKNLTSNDLFAGKRVVLFALPGAFTPTCSSTHLPRYNELADTFRNQGIDDIICLSVNDAFVMEAWGKDLDAANITLLPDGNGHFSAGMGLLVDKEELGFGKRSWRYSMLVDNGVIEKMFIEPEKAGDPFEVSDADTMLNYINADAKLPDQVTLFSKPGCPHCAHAKSILEQRGYQYENIELGSHGVSYASLKAVTGRGTTPQIFINGTHIGGAEDLDRYFAQK